MSRARRPDPPPMQTNDVRIAAAGTAAWAIALVVLLIVGLPSDDRWWLWVCVAGIGIGLFALWYVPKLQSRRAREEAARATQQGAAQHGAALQPGASPAVDREQRPAEHADDRERVD